MFHTACGNRISLLNGNKTAKRNLSEFNHGLVFSKEPLHDNSLFEVRIEKKVCAVLNKIKFTYCMNIVLKI